MYATKMAVACESTSRYWKGR